MLQRFILSRMLARLFWTISEVDPEIVTARRGQLNPISEIAWGLREQLDALAFIMIANLQWQAFGMIG